MQQKLNLKDYFNLSVLKSQHDNVLYIGRYNAKSGCASPLANPFVIGADGDRDQVIARYRRWLWQQISAKNPAILRELSRINDDTVFVCWCSPEACHADVLMDWYRYKKEYFSLTVEA